MNKLAVIMAVAGFCLLSACVKNSSEYKQLKAESDSLRLENVKSNMQIEEMMSIMNEIEADFQSIRSAENYLNVQRQEGSELTPSVREQIKSNMMLIGETLKKNKEQISKLEAMLNKNNIQSDVLRKTVERLSSELEQKAGMIISMQNELENKNIHIEELSREVSSLKDDMEELATKSNQQSKQIESQDTELNTAYYCFGTSRELKDQKILSGGGLFAKSKALQNDFNRDYFRKIDIRKTTEIQLFSHKATLKSNHPNGSYEFVKDEDGNLTFKITDIKVFWGIGKYLVIEVV